MLRVITQIFISNPMSMRTFSKHFFAALLGTALISSCSRPVAYFQPTAREQFKSTPSEAVAVTTPAPGIEAAEMSAPAVAVRPVGQVSQAKQAVSQVEAYVRNDNKLASNKKLTKRMERLNEVLASASTKAPISANASTKKTTLMERMMLKKIDKKIKNHVAPDATKAMTSNMRLGIIIGLIGLLLLIVGSGVLSVIGGIALVVGIVLVVLGLINNA